VAKYLKPNHGTEIPTRHVAFDTETDSTKDPRNGKVQILVMHFVVGCYWELRRGKATEPVWRTFSDPVDFWEWVESYQRPKSPLTVWAHNLGFDLSVSQFWQRLEIGHYRTHLAAAPDAAAGQGRKRKFDGLMVLENNPCFLNLMGRRGRVRFSDTFNYFPCSLAKIGESVGLKKSSIDFDACTLEEKQIYCRRDVEIVRRIVTRTLLNWKELDCGIWRETAAGNALTNWRHWYLSGDSKGTPKYLLTEQDKVADAGEKSGYYGGRTEVFFAGKVVERGDAEHVNFTLDGDVESPFLVGPVYELDCNSLYPWAMRGFTYPCRRLASTKTPTVDALRRRIETDGAMASVRIKTDEACYPWSDGKSLLFPIGEFDTILCGEELKHALDNGRVTSIGGVRWYAMQPLFKDWVEKWYSEKLNSTLAGDESLRLFAKMMLNSLSGKWSQSGRRWVDDPHESPPVKWGTWHRSKAPGKPIEAYRSIGGLVQVHREVEPANFSFPAISAFITANARQRLWKLICGLPAASLLYVSTDSLLVTGDGYDALCAANEVCAESLGKLSVRGVYQTAEIRGENDLRLGNRVVKAGRPLRGLLEADGTYSCEVWESLPGILARGPDGSVRITTQSHRDDRVKTKRVATPTGWTAPPFKRILREEDGKFLPPPASD
jgi:hypothetical protein